MTVGDEARHYLRAHRSGVLSTLSERLAGYPFGSIVPFVLDSSCRPVILVSALAEHTKNLGADPRTSLIVHDYVDDVQAGARLTLVGKALPVGDDATARSRYLRSFPAARDLFRLGDFALWAIEPAQLLFIRGFGRIDWISVESFRPLQSRIGEVEDDILAHMNADHSDALVAYCRHFHGLQPHAAEMVGIDCDGFNVRADGKLLRFDFDRPVTDAAEARAALVALARAARG